MGWLLFSPAPPPRWYKKKYTHLSNTADQLSGLPSVVPLWQVLWIYICISLSSHPTVFPVGVVTIEEAGVAGMS